MRSSNTQGAGIRKVQVRSQEFYPHWPVTNTPTLMVLIEIPWNRNLHLANDKRYASPSPLGWCQRRRRRRPDGKSELSSTPSNKNSALTTASVETIRGNNTVISTHQ